MNIVRPVRVRFAKRGMLIYISHLDLTRTFTRAFMRAELPIWYSEGFNPHPRFNFALPLSVGVSSECEFLDMKFVSDMSDEEAKRRLSAALPSDIEILEVYTPETKFNSITGAEYEIWISAASLADGCGEAARLALTASPLTVLKRTKSGERETDISPYISGLETSFSDGVLKITATLCADSENYLNPEYLVGVVEASLSLSLREDITSQVDIRRTAVFAGKKSFR